MKHDVQIALVAGALWAATVSPVAAASADPYFEQLDANDNQQLSTKELEELPRVLPRSMLRRLNVDDTPDELKKKWDSDGSGSVSRSEWEHAKAQWQGSASQAKRPGG